MKLPTIFVFLIILLLSSSIASHPREVAAVETLATKNENSIRGFVMRDVDPF